jgi:hypothetical protein
MAIRRGALSADSFTMVPHHWSRDPNLSWKAKGILAYIAGHAADYDLTVAQMISEGKDRKDAVLSGVTELVKAGYLTRVRPRNDDGTLGAYDYQVVEFSDSADQSGKSAIDEERAAGQGTEPEPGIHKRPNRPSPKSRTGSHQQEQGVSAGGNQRGSSTVDNPPTKKTTSKKTKKTTSQSSTVRGARLPEGFMPDESMRAWFVENRIAAAGVDGVTEHARFVDYWRAKAGANGTKLDWPATWRNWMRTAAERKGGVPAAGASIPQQRQEFKSSAEKKAEADARDRAKAKIGDALFAQLGRSINSMTEPEKAAFWAKVDEIYEDQVRGRSAPGYTGVVDAEVISEYTVQEVTGHAAG